MARLGFGLASLASLGFLAWFVARELNSPGLSFAAALVAMPMLLALFGIFKVQGKAIAKDGRAAGWIAVITALFAVGYVAAFFGSWLIVAIVWFASYIPMIIGLVTSPRTES